MAGMNNSQKRSGKTCLSISLLAVLGVGIIGALFAYFYFFGNMPWRNIASQLSGPAVTIQVPAPDTQVKEEIASQFQYTLMMSWV